MACGVLKLEGSVKNLKEQGVLQFAAARYLLARGWPSRFSLGGQGSAGLFFFSPPTRRCPSRCPSTRLRAVWAAKQPIRLRGIILLDDAGLPRPQLGHSPASIRPRGFAQNVDSEPRREGGENGEGRGARDEEKERKPGEKVSSTKAWDIPVLTVIIVLFFFCLFYPLRANPIPILHLPRVS